MSGLAKYRCPSCQRRTCSLNCVQLHKEKWSCNGKRSRTAYTSLKEFGDKELISDTHFLEDVKRVKETNWRNLRRVALVFRPQEIPPHQRKLRYEARQRGMRLHYLPKGMARNKSNTSWFDYRREEICWDIDWVVPFLNKSPLIRRKRVPESDTVFQAMQTVISSLRLDNSALYTVVMKKCGCPANEAVYLNLDTKATLKSQLEGTEIIEYPVLLILRELDKERYNIQMKSCADCTSA